MKNVDTRMQIKQLVFLVLVIFSLLMLFWLLLAPQAAAAGPATPLTMTVAVHDTTDCDGELVRQAERDYLDDRTNLTRRFGDFELALHDSLSGNLVVAGGDAVISGHVSGTVLVVCGNITMTSTSSVDGDVVAVSGTVKRFEGSRIGGDQVETSPESRHHSRARRREDKGWDWERNWERQRQRLAASFDVDAHYNRVDGLYLGGSLPRKYRGFANIGMFGFGGYGFKAKRWQYQGGAEFYIGREFCTALGAEAHDFTDTEDGWIIPRDENTAAALFIKEDFQDYYRRKGFSIFGSQSFGDDFKLTAGYRRDDLLTLENRAVWSLFGGKKKFRQNPTIDEGRLVSYFAEFGWDGRDHERSPRRGWFMNVMAEVSRPSFESDFDYDRVIVDVRRYIPIGYGKNLDVRLRAGSSSGVLPAQFFFDLGGISTLQGHRYKELTGNRMLLGSLEYRMNAGRSRLHDIPILSEFNLILFVDSGMIWKVDEGAGLARFENFDWNRLKTDIGVAITDNDGRVRLNFAKRTDRGNDDLVVTFRLNRAF